MACEVVRFGQQGTIIRVWALRGKRAYAPKQTDFEWIYAFGVVCPELVLYRGLNFAGSIIVQGYTPLKASKPPSIVTTEPVAKDAESLNSQIAAPISSLGSPNRF